MNLTHSRRRGCGPRCRPAAERGFTLMELLVVVTIMALIAGGVAGSLIMSFRVFDEVQRNVQGSANRDVSSALWSEDVATVDATGVNQTTDKACGYNTTATSGGTLKVTFNRTRRLDNGDINIKRVSYWVVGAARTMRLMRFECASDKLTTLTLTPLRTTIVASDIYNPDLSADDNVAPFRGSGIDPNTGVQYSVCTEYECGLNINSTYAYELRAQRRVYGAGVPLEVNKLYSSAASRREASVAGTGNQDRFRLRHYDALGAAGTKEAIYPNMLTLAPGLDDSVGVQFQVQQVTTGRWLEKTGTPTPTIKWGTDPNALVGGTYTAGQWSLPLTVGTEGDNAFSPGLIDAGGLYRVFTTLTENGRTKRYGGADGFPMWFDWQPGNVVFVDGSVADDTGTGMPDTGVTVPGNAGLPRPKKTWDAALAVVKDSDPAQAGNQRRPELLVRSTGTAMPRLAINTLNSVDNFTVQGAFTDKWLRRGANSSPTATNWQTSITGSQDLTVRGQCPLGAATDCFTDPSVGLRIDGVKGVRIQQFAINSGTINIAGIAAIISCNQATTCWNKVGATAASTYGAMVVNSASVTFVNTDLSAQAGLAVSDSVVSPVDSAPAVFACSGVRSPNYASTPNTSKEARAFTGATAESGVDCTAPTGRNGGYGGEGGKQEADSGGTQRGYDGSVGGVGGSTTGGGAGGAGGAGGTGTINLNPVDCVGREGAYGRGGKGGSGGTVGDNIGFRPGGEPSASAGGWLPGFGRDGTNGLPGGAGGGSGGGGGNGCPAGRNPGRQGSSGGNGGRGGIGGVGGLGGGSSIGLFLFDAGTIRFVTSGASANTGGRGRHGQNGSFGGAAGQGGGGWADATPVSRAGGTAGAGGGGGGGGGAGGNGGRGGYSIAIMMAGTSTRPITGDTGTTLLSDPTVLGIQGGGPGGNGGLVPDADGPSGPRVAGGGTGAPGGKGDNATWGCWNIFGWTGCLNRVSTADGENGTDAVSAAATGKVGREGTNCRIWKIVTNPADTGYDVRGTCLVN